MQAQIPLNPYIGLWSRLSDFEPGSLSRPLINREVVRIVVMRSTLHLVSAADCLLLRPLMQPVLDKELNGHPEYGAASAAVDKTLVLDFVRDLVEDKPHSGRQLRKALEQRFPHDNAAALAYASRNWLPFVQVPPRGVWGQSAQVSSTTAESWLGRSLAETPSIDDLVLRYFAAFGPASVADVSAWSRLTGLREVVERLRGRLLDFTSEQGGELFDIPDAPRPSPQTAAPPRFLPEYDNAVLSHADRSRCYVSAAQKKQLYSAPGPVHGSVLIDGFVRAVWRIDRGKESGIATLVVSHTGTLQCTTYTWSHFRDCGAPTPR